MKLSKKGRDRLYGSHNVFYDDDIEGDVVALYELSEVWEFEPDDFEGCVCLTVEEASEVSLQLYRLAQLYSLQILELDSDKKLIKPLAKTYESLNEKIVQAMKTKRIEQAEGKR